jgi:hypothetical protein
MVNGRNIRIRMKNMPLYLVSIIAASLLFTACTGPQIKTQRVVLITLPSVTLPNWTIHLTGSGPEEHGGVSSTEMEVLSVIAGPGIKKGHILAEPKNTVNTAVTISYLLNCEIPLSWIGEIPMSIFEHEL